MWTTLAWRSGSGNGGERWVKKKELESGIAICDFGINEMVQKSQQ